MFSLLYMVQIGTFAPSLMWPAILVIAATIVVMLTTSLLQMRVTHQQMEYAAKENGKSFALIYGVQKIKLAGAEPSRNGPVLTRRAPSCSTTRRSS